MEDALSYLIREMHRTRLGPPFKKLEDDALELQTQVRALSDRLDRMALISQTMWELLRERTNLTNEEIVAKMEEIDLRDGVADGKIRPKVFICETCGHKVNDTNERCIYCGAAKTMS